MKKNKGPLIGFTLIISIIIITFLITTTIFSNSNFERNQKKCSEQSIALKQELNESIEKNLTNLIEVECFYEQIILEENIRNITKYGCSCTSTDKFGNKAKIGLLIPK